MDSTAPRRVPASQRLALIGHDRADSIAAHRDGMPITAATLVADIRRTAESLPDRRHVLNFCSDRYRFAVLLCAAIMRRQISLLPPTTTPNVIESMREFAPDAYFVSDDPQAQIALPRFELPSGNAAPDTQFAVPRIDVEQVVACIFTSGSTG
ncbi:MAG TPA: beta-hydroxyacyl-ACP dehydratase, partial [Casimicrobiaceae bacterium]|nr:beta-hydroxyacyl-ACP dehydratase [Casimicrobiaceae bacterium]